ncbi:transketolase [[Eubacterium] hominis]|uniref:transketolase n=1 Tax=[Eubacterium] hominis TaxID=2764325 RepID=UPI003A4E5416
MNKTELVEHSKKLRRGIVEVCYQSKAGHVGGSLSGIDILNVLYNHVLHIDPTNPKKEDRDRFILSKGHIAEALFVTLADRGFFKEEELKTFSTYQSKYIGHPNNKINGVEMNTGALGHGLSLGVGMAIAAKMDHKEYRTYVMMGDGEQAEGSIWEAAMAAAHYKLDNLVAILDRNGLQISGTTEEVMSLKNIRAKWEGFGFEVIEIDGNDIDEILNAFDQAKQVKDKPVLILAHTVKGKGVSFMENEVAWHHGVLNEEQYHLAMQELGGVC